MKQDGISVKIGASFSPQLFARADMDLVYKCTTLYEPASDRAILWNDPEIGIEWPIGEPVLSGKDGRAPRLAEANALPVYS
jgi:dTDP-4-dehydrorhamnose 3,5-epimerase-like enzyme